MPERLTPTLINQLKPSEKQYIVTDSKTPGLTIMVRPNGSKRFYYRYRHPENKKVISEPIGSTLNLSLTDARAAAVIKAGEIAKGKDIRAERKQKAVAEISHLNADLRLFNYIDKYYEPYALKNSVTANEIVRILKREFLFIKDKRIDEICSSDIESWRDRRGKEVTFKRIKIIVTYLKVCLNTALKHYKLIDRYELQTYTLKRKPHEKVNPPKLRFLLNGEESKLLKALEARDQELREKRARYVEWQSKRKHSKRHVELFLDSDYPDHITPIVMLAFHTGFDLGDLFDLNWGLHVDFENNQIRKVRNKTSHKQDNPQPVVVPMTPIVKKALEQWGRQHGMAGRVFKSPKKGGRFDNITTAWTSIKTKAGLDNFRFKDFRHTFGSRLAIAGVDILVIRDLMGHTDVKTTQIYAHLCPQQKTDAVMAAFA